MQQKGYNNTEGHDTVSKKFTETRKITVNNCLCESDEQKPPTSCPILHGASSLTTGLKEFTELGLTDAKAVVDRLEACLLLRGLRYLRMLCQRGGLITILVVSGQAPIWLGW